jgi:hypothetical protein
MDRLRFVTTAAAVGSSLVMIGAPSQAAWWGGTADGGYPNVNQVFPEVTALLKDTPSRRVQVVNAQMYLLCTNPVDEDTTLLAFDVSSQPVRTRRGRFLTRVVSNGPDLRAVTLLRGRLLTSGQGRMTAAVEGIRRSSAGGNIGACEGEAIYRLRRGPTR